MNDYDELTKRLMEAAEEIGDDDFAIAAQAIRGLSAQLTATNEAALSRDADYVQLFDWHKAAREALWASLVFAERICDAADIDPEETKIAVRVMPEGREAATKSWAEVMDQVRDVLGKGPSA